MIEQILRAAGQTGYDFRATANPADPLAHLFDERVAYYKVKWAVADVLKPSSILEIGVRYGYSAAAFLDASPGSRYLGIDLDADTFGGVKGAIDWAREITRGSSAEFLVADTQSLDRLPGGVYDLIHVDGQQDGDGSWHDLELALKQARFILLDGFLWTPTNYQAASQFLYRYADLLDYYAVIPGYAGELLIKVSERATVRSGAAGGVGTSLDLRGEYTSDYYLRDCGGFDSYKRTGGKALEDARLQAVAAIAEMRPRGRVLELGCGRGELTHDFAWRGYRVTAVDYSPSAIELARRCFEGEEALARNVDFRIDDVCTVPLDGPYDLATASDVIEHLTPQEVDTLYERVSRSLLPDGLFVVHTFPNLWYYRYEYPRRRRVAASVGAYLPPEPRSRYELLMHINEQSPRVLNRQLRRHFEHVIVWFANPYAGDACGSLREGVGRRALREAPDLFAVASHRPIDRRHLKGRLRSDPLPPTRPGEVELSVVDSPGAAEAGTEFEARVRLVNRSEHVLSTCSPNPTHLSYHWLEGDPPRALIFNGLRSSIRPALGPGEEGLFVVKVATPEVPGRYVLRLTLVQELVRWFDQDPTWLASDVIVAIGQGGTLGRGGASR